MLCNEQVIISVSRTCSLVPRLVNLILSFPSHPQFYAESTHLFTRQRRRISDFQHLERRSRIGFVAMDSSVIRGLDLAVPAESQHLHASHSSPPVPLRAWQSADNVPSDSQGTRSALSSRVQTSTCKVQDGETISDNRRASSANFDPSVGLGTSDLNMPRHRPAADILSDLVPKSSVLQRSIDQQRSRVWLIDSDDDTFLGSVNWMQDITKLQKKILESRSRLAAGSVLVIEDLNTKTCEVLGLEYPHLDQAFLVEHMLRFDELPTNAVLEDLNSHWLEADRIHVERFSLFSGTYMGTDLVLKSPLLARDERSFHLDLKCEFRFEFHRARTAPLNVLETMHGVSVPSSRLRSESFARSVDGVWRKSSTRISCCRLPGNSGRSTNLSPLTVSGDA